MTRISVLEGISDHLGGRYGATLFSQPVVPLRSSLEGFQEILLRIRDSDNEWRSPVAFLEKVQKHNLAWLVDRDIIRSVFAWLQRQRNPKLICSINLCPESVEKGEGLISVLLEQFEVSKFSFEVQPSQIIFEISERTIVGVENNSNEFLASLHDMGIKIALDDFGVQSLSIPSLQYADFLKIDISFVQKLATDTKQGHEARETVKALASIARAHGVKSVAEGVENELILNEVIKQGCDYAQGWYSRLGPPSPLNLE